MFETLPVESPLAERAARILQSAEYRRDLIRHTKLAIGALVVGFCGSLISLFLVLESTSSTRIMQFWLLCLILSAGVFAVAALTFAGSLSAHLSMQRLAFCNKDLEAFEATREKAILVFGIAALASLVEELAAKRQTVDCQLVGYSLRCLALTEQEQREVAPGNYEMKSILDRWRALGASPDKVDKFGDLTTSDRVGP